MQELYYNRVIIIFNNNNYVIFIFITSYSCPYLPLSKATGCTNMIGLLRDMRRASWSSDCPGIISS